MKQTAVEWLIEKLKLQGLLIGEPDNLVAVRQAKEMQKEQHKNTWFDSTAQFDNAAQMTYKKTFEQYYNETFKNK